VAGELARDRDGDDSAALAAMLERVPALMEAAGAGVGAGAYCYWLALSAPLKRGACAQLLALVPGCPDQQPARVRVAGFAVALRQTIGASPQDAVGRLTSSWKRVRPIPASAPNSSASKC
jgi:hypothetical protein